MDDRMMAAHVETMDALEVGRDDLHDWIEASRCPACGDVIDYCSGHGSLGDPDGARVLALHDDGDHDECHPRSDCKFEEQAP